MENPYTPLSYKWILFSLMAIQKRTDPQEDVLAILTGKKVVGRTYMLMCPVHLHEVESGAPPCCSNQRPISVPFHAMTPRDFEAIGLEVKKRLELELEKQGAELHA